MSEEQARVEAFVKYTRSLRGAERSESQVFCDRLFQAFGHAGYKEAGAELEFVVKAGKEKTTTRYADLRWKNRLLLEMKSKGAKLQAHYRQAFDYWINAVPHRPRYVVLCNFEEFWIYDFDLQLHEPVDRIKIDDLTSRYTAFNFLFPDERPPQFQNDLVAVTRGAAAKVAEVFHCLIKRDVPRVDAQRFVLQCVVSMFAEDIDLLPRGTFTRLVQECVGGASTYDLLGGLFRQMNSQQPARGGRFREVPYFNGGLFAEPALVELRANELIALAEATEQNWAKVEPAIFGTIFQASMEQGQRHAYGAHYTSEAEIQRVVLPTIVRPLEEEMRAARTATQLLALRARLQKFRVLDPACGSGNFLYVAYRELKRLELTLLATIRAVFERTGEKLPALSFVTPRQFFGIDTLPFAVELAKVTLVIAKKLAIDEEYRFFDQMKLPLEAEPALPLDNLDANILQQDALLDGAWPPADAIIGNPPYQAKNKMQQEYGPEYVSRVRKKFPEVPGRADYCVYWFRKAHDSLSAGGRAGLVGTNTIRQNYSRRGGLEYIVANGGTITEAVSTQVWPGEAVVHVSIVNWVKDRDPKGLKRLTWQTGDAKDSPWDKVDLPRIGPSLSSDVDVSSATPLRANSASGACYQGQTHGHEGFVLTPAEAKALVSADRSSRDVIFPYLIGKDLLTRIPPSPSRFVIDFQPRDLLEASEYKPAFAWVKERVLPDRQKSAKKEETRNATLKGEGRGNKHHEQFLKRWWLLSWPREELMSVLARLPRYIVCVRVTKRPVFVFVSPKVHPNDALSVFPLSDDYSFGILQSGIHWTWFIARCSTLKRDPRYTSDTVFDTFPWPQNVSAAEAKAVAAAGQRLRALRDELLAKHELTLQQLYRSLELPGVHRLKQAHEDLDQAVRSAYGIRRGQNLLAFLLGLNAELATIEQRGGTVVGPGVPKGVTGLVSKDCLEP